MGEAKRRGTYEQRCTQALEKLLADQDRLARVKAEQHAKLWARIEEQQRQVQADRIRPKGKSRLGSQALVLAALAMLANQNQNNP